MSTQWGSTTVENWNTSRVSNDQICTNGIQASPLLVSVESFEWEPSPNKDIRAHQDNFYKIQQLACSFFGSWYSLKASRNLFQNGPVS